MQDLKLVYYGDDFTGSTDCLEVLATNGLRTVLFLRIPDEKLIEERFPDAECIGIAGTSRAQARDEMSRELLPALEFLWGLPASLVHYKICSTFDSSPEVGSIGLVVDLVNEHFGHRVIPLLVGAPALKRYTVFANHFATVKDETFRLDRHPTMSRHPITPMDESDLRVLLSRQTSARIAHMDLFAQSGAWDAVRQRFDELVSKDPGVVLFDVLDDERLAVAGELIWSHSSAGNRFVIGSSGIEYALASYWRKNRRGPVPGAFANQSVGPKQTLVLSGSCSPVTMNQIDFALKHGFHGVRLPISEVQGEEQRAAQAADKVIAEVLDAWGNGQSVVLFSALGPDDVVRDGPLDASGDDDSFRKSIGNRIGSWLGSLGRRIISKAHVERVVVAGGDTSGYAVSQMNILALQMKQAIEPGGPLCVAYSEDEDVDPLEIVLKGGQVGSDRFLLHVAEGTSAVPKG